MFVQRTHGYFGFVMYENIENDFECCHFGVFV